MEIGEHCTLSDCRRLTFLPVTCAYCRHQYCQSHFLPLQHSCQAPGAAEADRTLSDSEILKRIQRVNARRRDVQAAAHAGGEARPTEQTDEEEPSRLPCQQAGCKRFSLQLDAPLAEPNSLISGSTRPVNVSTRDGRQAAFTHAAPRCDRCRGFFCMPHRSYVAHGCTAPAPPTEGDRRRDAANERKRRAREVLNKHFPNRSVKPTT